MLELPSSAHPQWDMVPPVPGKHPRSPKGMADLRDFTCSLLRLCFTTVLEKREEWGKTKSTACLHLLPAELRRETAQGSGVAGVKATKRGGCCAVQRDVPGYRSACCDSHLNSFATLWCHFWWCRRVRCIILALPSFLTFGFAFHRELSNSQKGGTLISRGVCLYPNVGKPEEFIRRLK